MALDAACDDEHGEADMTGFEGQLAVVTGAAGGIGGAIARGLAAAGADLALVDIKDTDLAPITSVATSARQSIRAWQCNVTNSDSVASVCKSILAEQGPVSILVNNVGGSGDQPMEQVEDLTDEVWDHVLSLNIGSIMRFCRSLVPGMKERRYGRIINVSSTLKDGMPGRSGTVAARIPYVTAKSAIVGMTKQLSLDLGAYGITVNAIAPGFTLPGEDARITKRFRALSPEDQGRITAGIPMGRPAMGEDMANAACFLAAPQSGYVTGEILAVAGGA
jgi:NAD(P)-dependent dehydrogenase (short-subunit alcohol dehydrogenase family)